VNARKTKPSKIQQRYPAIRLFLQQQYLANERTWLMYTNKKNINNICSTRVKYFFYSAVKSVKHGFFIFLNKFWAG